MTSKDSTVAYRSYQTTRNSPETPQLLLFQVVPPHSLFYTCTDVDCNYSSKRST